MASNAKRERFTKVATNRVQKVIDYLNLLQNCSNRNNYDYDQEDVDQMFEAINKALKDARNMYSKELNKTSKSGFSFKK
ncbi:MAG: hypothetical protein IJK49_10610 [Prevotella sp.]|nr:hypothetical protein [Prevotella sp.]